MNKMTHEEVVEMFKKIYDIYEECKPNVPPPSWWPADFKGKYNGFLFDLFSGDVRIENENFPHVRVVELVNGEDGGEYCHGVIELDGKYFFATWKCYSYGEYDYCDIESTIKEVFPVEKTIIVYQ